jgi:hypothetical protein
MTDRTSEGTDLNGRGLKHDAVDLSHLDASQKIGLSKSAGLDVELGGTVGEVSRASVRVRKGSLTERVHQFGRPARSDIVNDWFA